MISHVHHRLESLLAVNILCLGSQLSEPVLSLLLSLASSTTLSSSGAQHPQQMLETHRALLSLGSGPHSVSLFRDTPTVASRASEDETRHSQGSSLPKKGTRFKLPDSELDTLSFCDHRMDLDVLLSSKHRAQVDTLNVLGVQPSFREPYPESVYTDVAETINDGDESRFEDEDSIYLHDLHSDDLLHPARHRERRELCAGMLEPTADVDSIATQSLVDSELVPKTIDSSRASTCSQIPSGCGELGSALTLGRASPSHSFIITSSPWLKSSTSKNWSNVNVDHSRLTVESGDHGSGDAVALSPESRREQQETAADKSDSVCGNAATEEEETESSLRESLDKLGTLGSPSHLAGPPPAHNPMAGGASGRNVFSSRSVETRCTHYTHSSSVLSGGAGVPGSHIAPSTIYRPSVYSPLTIDIEEEAGSEDEVIGGGGGGGGTSVAHHTAFHGWPSEVAVGYTVGMCDVVMYSRTSHIQTTALHGVTQGEDSRGELLGLKQLAEFSLPDHSPSGQSSTYTSEH